MSEVEGCPGWWEYESEEGVPYFFNDETEETRWEHPSLAGDGGRVAGDSGGNESGGEHALDLSGAVAGSETQPRAQEDEWVVGDGGDGGSSSGDGDDKMTQFKQAVGMLKSRGVFGGVRTEEMRSIKPTRNRLSSQFSESRAMLAKLGIFDAPSGTAARAEIKLRLPNAISEEDEYAEKPKGDEEEEMPVITEGFRDDEEVDALSAVKASSAAEASPAPATTATSNVTKWEPIGVEAVSFICFDVDERTVTMPMWAAGTHGNLQVGMVVLAWEGLVTWGPTSNDPFLIPYENMVMWTLDPTDAALDITMEGTFDPTARKLKLLTGEVIDLRVCLPTPTVAFELYKSLKEVCTRVGKEKRAQLDKEALRRTKLMADKVKTLALAGMSGRQRRLSVNVSASDAAADDVAVAVNQAAILKQARRQLKGQ